MFYVSVRLWSGKQMLLATSGNIFMFTAWLWWLVAFSLSARFIIQWLICFQYIYIIPQNTTYNTYIYLPPSPTLPSGSQKKRKEKKGTANSSIFVPGAWLTHKVHCLFHFSNCPLTIHWALSSHVRLFIWCSQDCSWWTLSFPIYHYYSAGHH